MLDLIQMCDELVEFAGSKFKKKINKIKKQCEGRKELLDFEYRAIYGMICHAAYLIYIEKGLPDSIRARLYLGEKNYWVVECLALFKEENHGNSF